MINYVHPARVTPEQTIAATLKRRGWTVRRAEPVGTGSRFMIMAYRRLAFPGLVGMAEETREYVVASMRPTDTEWCNGDYSFDPAVADTRYRLRSSLRTS